MYQYLDGACLKREIYFLTKPCLLRLCARDYISCVTHSWQESCSMMTALTYNQVLNKKPHSFWPVYQNNLPWWARETESHLSQNKTQRLFCRFRCFCVIPFDPWILTHPHPNTHFHHIFLHNITWWHYIQLGMTFNNFYNNWERETESAWTYLRECIHSHTNKLEKISAIVDKIYGI